MKTLKNIILFIWQMPQALLGYLLLLLVYTPKYVCEVDGVKMYFVDRIAQAVNFGQFSLISSRIYRNVDDISELNVVKHELGHSKQSKMLSWLYPFVVMIPAYFWSRHFRKQKLRSVRYFDFFTEKWADRLGNVKRSS